MGISKTSDHIQIKIKMPTPSQEPSASSKAPNEDLKAMDVLCPFKIKIEIQNLKYGCIQSGTSTVLQSPKSGPKGFWNMDVSKTSGHIQIKMKMLNPNQEPQASTKAQNEDINDMDVFCNFKTKIGSQNSAHGCIKDQ